MTHDLEPGRWPGWSEAGRAGLIIQHELDPGEGKKGGYSGEPLAQAEEAHGAGGGKRRNRRRAESKLPLSAGLA